jgi:16S rRNA U516 pseudouridylate synthase RsuA-like enzyme
MKVLVEKTKGKRGATFRTNSWLRITSTDGKNRQIRNVFSALGMTVTRLIRIQVRLMVLIILILEIVPHLLR